MQRAAVQESSADPGLSTICGVRLLTYSNIRIPAGHLGHCARQPLAAVLPSISPKSNLSWLQPSQPPLVGWVRGTHRHSCKAEGLVQGNC